MVYVKGLRFYIFTEPTSSYHLLPHFHILVEYNLTNMERDLGVIGYHKRGVRESLEKSLCAIEGIVGEFYQSHLKVKTEGYEFIKNGVKKVPNSKYLGAVLDFVFKIQGY